MHVIALRRVPWTCEWGRFGVTAEIVNASETRVDDVFWACHNPALAPGPRPLARDECERCPMWVPAARFLAGDLQ
jgi:hypothetical protein